MEKRSSASQIQDSIPPMSWAGHSSPTAMIASGMATSPSNQTVIRSISERLRSWSTDIRILLTPGISRDIVGIDLHVLLEHLIKYHTTKEADVQSGRCRDKQNPGKSLASIVPLHLLQILWICSKEVG